MFSIFQEQGDEEARADEASDRDDATLDQAPSIHSSLESSMPSLADVSLQTGQSLLENDVVEKPQQVSRQTSTNQMPPSTVCHSLTTQTVDTMHPDVENPQTQETITILKTTEGDHDVIEIATKNLPSASVQEIVQDRPDTIAEDIVVDMKYQDPANKDNTTSELNIFHATPQSFETVLVEPDDVTTEVVVDEDGSKRIIVRKLRRTTMTSRQTTQQHLSSMSTAIGDAPSTVHAFSEATMRNQQVTVTTAKPNGTIETTTKQIYGGRVATGTPFKDVNVEEYESAPQYTHVVTQGQIRDISPQPLEEGILMEGGECQAKTSSVHAVVQQVTRRVVRKTRRIIRKVTIIDGKETATEEIIEEPEEVEIDEKSIPHISINVIKQEDQRHLGAEVQIEEEKTEESRPKIEKIKEEEDIMKKDGGLKDVARADTPMQGPFFGAFAKDMHPSTNQEEEEIFPDTGKDVEAKRKVTDVIEISQTEQIEEKPQQIPIDSKVESLKPESLEKKPEIMDKYEHEQFVAEVTGKKSLPVSSQAFIDAEVSAALQSPSQEIKIQEVSQVAEESVRSPIDTTMSEDVPSIEKATCKSVGAPVIIETPGMEVEGRTVDVEKHPGTVDTSVLEEQPKKAQELSEGIPKTVEISGEPEEPVETKKEEPRVLPINVKQQIVKDSFVPEIDYDYVDEALKPEYKPIFHKVEISLAVKKEGEEVEPMVSVKSQTEPRHVAYGMVKEDVDISLPADKESTSVIHDKIVQTSPPMPERPVTLEKEVATSDKSVLTSEKEETDKSIITSEKDETSDKSLVPSEREEECQAKRTESEEDTTVTKIEEEIGSPMKSSTSMISNLADSMEIDIPLSDSSKQVSEAPQPDVTKMFASGEMELSLKDETSEGEDGYEADRTMVSTTTPDDENVTRTKKKKKRKQRIRSSREEEPTEFPKTTTDEGEFTDDVTSVESEDAKATKKKKKKRKREEVDPIKDKPSRSQEFSVSVATSPKHEEVSEIYVQTSPQLEGRKVEISDIHKQVQTSPQVPEDVEVPKVEVNTEMQTSPLPGLDFASQTVQEEIHKQVQTSPQIPEDIQVPEVEEVHTEMQTSPLLGLDFSTQTVQESPETHHSEMQTSPLPGSDFAVQTVTEKPTIEETSTQTLEIPGKEFEEYAVQTSPIEDIQVTVVTAETEETQVQTVPADVVSMEAQTSPTAPSIEMETQTAEKTVVAVEQQTTPSPIEEKVSTCIAVQTVTPEVPEIVETESQTSKPVTPETTTLDFNVQADLAKETPPFEVVETQTTPEESPRQAVTQETESQTILPQPTQESTMQTSPISVSPITIDVCELSAQTSLEEAKQLTDEHSQTIPPEKIETLDSSVQIKTSELVPRVEESVQIIPETRDGGVQTSVDEEKPSFATISQQTNGTLQEIDAQGVQATVDVVDASTDAMTPVKYIEIPVAPDVQVQETKEELKMIRSPKVELTDEFIETERLQGLLEQDEPKSEDKELSISDDTVKPTDTSQDTSVSEDLSAAKVDDGSLGRRHKRKRRYKTMEISSPSEKDLESIFGHPVESKDLSLKLSYSDVAKKNVGKEKSPPGDTHLEKISESEDMPQKEESEPMIVKDTQDVWTLGTEKPDSEIQQVPIHVASPEPMDTTEEQFSPAESVLQEEDRPRIKTYADIITESSKKLDPKYEEVDQTSWEMSRHPVPSKDASSKAFLLAETMEYDPQLQVTQSNQTTKAISDRMQSLRNAKQPSHLGNILHIAHLDQVANEKLAEERAADVRKELSRLKDAAQEKDSIAAEETLVVIVDTISTWLETIEYRIFLSKECPSGPSHEDKTYVELRDEVENVEENINELNDIWKLVGTNYPESDRINLQECLDALMHQVKMIEDVTADSEKHVTSELARWDEFVNGVHNMYR